METEFVPVLMWVRKWVHLHRLVQWNKIFSIS